MNSIYNTATAAAQNHESGAYNQIEPQSQWRRNHSQQRGHPTEPSSAHPSTREESPYHPIRGIKNSIKSIITDKLFKPAKKNDSVTEITDKLQFVIDEIHNVTKDYDITTAEVWPDVWATIGKFMSLELEDNLFRLETI